MLLLQVIRTLDMSNNFKLSSTITDGMPTGLRLAYFAWLSGIDLRAELPKTHFIVIVES